MTLTRIFFSFSVMKSKKLWGLIILDNWLWDVSICFTFSPFVSIQMLTNTLPKKLFVSHRFQFSETSGWNKQVEWISSSGNLKTQFWAWVENLSFKKAKDKVWGEDEYFNRDFDVTRLGNERTKIFLWRSKLWRQSTGKCKNEVFTFLSCILLLED